jgi:hypothetical protein
MNKSRSYAVIQTQSSITCVLTHPVTCIKSTFTLESIYSIITTLSDLIDRRIDFDQWEFCVVWATQILFLDVLSVVPPFLSHAWNSGNLNLRKGGTACSLQMLIYTLACKKMCQVFLFIWITQDKIYCI